MADIVTRSPRFRLPRLVVTTLLMITFFCVHAHSQPPAETLDLHPDKVALRLPFESELAPGMFLVATRRLRAPSFARTVILLIHYDQEGAHGVIVNRPSPIRVNKVLPNQPRSKTPSPYIYLGGPVAQSQLRILVETQQPSADMQRVLDNVYLSGSPEVLKHLLNQTTDPKRFRAFAGYAGWAPGQLENEVERGGWHIMPAEVDAIFDAAPASVWPRLVSRRELKRL